jgi:DNA polymerase-1
MKVRPLTKQAFELMHDGMVELAHVESHGIRVNTKFLKKTMADADKTIAEGEARLKGDKLWKVWRRRFRDSAKITAPNQMGEIVFGELGYPVKYRTETGKPKTDFTAFEPVARKEPFVKEWLHMAKVRKARNTFLAGIFRETVDGFFHPNFNMHVATTFRSSSGRDKEEDKTERDLNFQNLPIRDPEQSAMIRQCFIPRKGNNIGEGDFGGIEVKVSACYNHDPQLIKYIKDTTTDMHRDMAMECYMLTLDELGGIGSGQPGKMARYCAKNQYVFPEFYGSVYFQCAPALWESIDKYDLKRSDGLSLRKHLKHKGIKRLGECDPEKEPVRGTFEYHIQQVEKDFWGRRFKVYDQWKKDFWNTYQRRGWFKTFTGFRVEGIYKRNYVINNPIQGSAFHCLLWSLIRINRWLRKNKMKSLIVGQIHDSLIFDLDRKEQDEVLAKAVEVMTVDLPKAWDWLAVPLEVECEVAPDGESWHKKQKVKVAA